MRKLAPISNGCWPSVAKAHTTETEEKQSSLAENPGGNTALGIKEFRLHDLDDLDDIQNGNFLDTLKLLSHYDPMLNEHLQQKGTGLTILELWHSEWIYWFMWQKSFENNFKGRMLFIIQSSVIYTRHFPYWAECCDEIDDWEITEWFLEFKDFYKKTGSEIEEMIEKYDNRANMSGRVKGVQAKHFGEICIALRIFCILSMTVASGERALSKLKLKRKKNYLRSTSARTGFAVLPCCTLKLSWLESWASKPWWMTLQARRLNKGQW